MGRLSEIGVLAVVVELEQGATTLHLRLHHCGRGHFQHAVLLERFAECSKSCCAHLHDSGSGLATKDKMTVVVEGLRVGIRGDSCGDGFLVTGGTTDDSEEVCVKFTVVGGMLLRWDGTHFTMNGHGGSEGKSHNIVGLDHVSRQDALEVAITICQGKENDILLGSKAMNSAQHADTSTRTLRLWTSKLDNGWVGHIKANSDRLREGGVLLDNDLLRFLQDETALLRLLLLTDGQFLFLCGLLFPLLIEVGGLLHRRLGGRLPLQLVDILISGLGLGLARQILKTLARSVLQESVHKRLVGSGFGSGRGRVVPTDVFVDIDGSHGHWLSI